MGIQLWLAWFAEKDPQPLIRRLDPALRAKVLAALAGLVILGFALCFFAWLGARATRRYMNRPPRLLRQPQPAPSPDDWATKSLVQGPMSEVDPDE